MVNNEVVTYIHDDIETANYKKNNERLLLYENLKLKKQLLFHKVLTDLLLKLGSCYNQEWFFDTLIDDISDITNTQNVFIYLCNSKNELELKNQWRYQNIDLNFFKAKANELIDINNKNSKFNISQIEENNKNIIWIPIISKNNTIWLIEICIKELRLEKEDIDMIKKFIITVSDIIENIVSNEKLYEIKNDLIKNLDYDILMKNIINDATNLINAEHWWIFILNKEKQVMELKYSKWFYNDNKNNQDELYCIYKWEWLVWKIWETKKTILIDDYKKWSWRHKNPILGFSSIWWVPLKKWDGEIMWVIMLWNSNNIKINDKNIAVLERFAKIASITIIQSMAFREIQNLNISLNTLIDKQNQEIWMLKNHLPICCKCKQKVRTEKGWWDTIYNFLQDKPDMIKLSHTFCPDCYEEEMRECKEMKEGN